MLRKKGTYVEQETSKREIFRISAINWRDSIGRVLIRSDVPMNGDV